MKTLIIIALANFFLFFVNLLLGNLILAFLESLLTLTLFVVLAWQINKNEEANKASRYRITESIDTLRKEVAALKEKQRETEKSA